MKIYKNSDHFIKLSKPVVTIGTFDGVHIGHQKIIKRLKDIAQQENGETVLLTFFPHPRMVLHPDDNELKLLNTMDEKEKLLEKAGIEHLIIQPFTEEFSQMSIEEYVRVILIEKIGVKKLIIGYDHRFGKNREGTLEHLKNFSKVYGFEIEEIPAQDINNIKISSTKIRDALLNGDIKTANSYLGYDYFLSGNVIKGSQVGRSMSFPTANIEVKEKYKLVPANGVYAVKTELDGKYFNGMLNIGFRPTLKGKKSSIEIHIFDFNMEIYGKRLTVYFKEKIRDEKKFDDLEALRKQLLIDKNKSISLLK